MAVDGLLEELKCTLTSSSYLWYMSNVVVLVWFILHDKDYPLDITVVPDYDREVYQRFGEKLGAIIGKPVSEEHMARCMTLPIKWRAVQRRWTRCIPRR